MRRSCLLVLVLVLAACSSPAPDPTPPAPVAQSADFSGSGFAACPAPTGPAPAADALPAVSLSCMDGSGAMVELARATGKPMVVNLWASWCAPCGREMPAFQRLQDAAGDRLTVLGVSTEDSAGRAVSAAQEIDVRFANVYDREGAVRRGLRVNGLPATVFVDSDGRIVHVYNSTPLEDAGLRELVQRHLGVTVT